MKAAGAFNGLPRELRDTMKPHIVLVSRERIGPHGYQLIQAHERGANMQRAVTSGILALALCSILSPSAQATTVTVPSGLASGVARAVQYAQYYYGPYCKEAWGCGRYACGWQQQCYFPPSGRWRRGCPRGYTIQDGLCKPYRGY
jgi:hypothetical protein